MILLYLSHRRYRRLSGDSTRGSCSTFTTTYLRAIAINFHWTSKSICSTVETRWNAISGESNAQFHSQVDQQKSICTLVGSLSCSRSSYVSAPLMSRSDTRRPSSDFSTSSTTTMRITFLHSTTESYSTKDGPKILLLWKKPLF